MNCIIVDDEPLATDLMVDFVKRIPFLILLGTCKNAFEANEIIHCMRFRRGKRYCEQFVDFVKIRW